MSKETEKLIMDRHSPQYLRKTCVEMSKPKWLTCQEVEAIHNHVIEAAGGWHGLRDAS